VKSEEFFREVDEDLQRDRLAALWRRYGWFVIALAVAVVVGTAGGEAWRAWQQRSMQAEAARYEAAVQGLDADPAAAAGRLDAFARDSRSGYGQLARLREAQAKMAAKDEAGAVAALQTLADDRPADPLVRDLASLLVAERTIDTGDPAALKARLEPLAAAGAPYRLTARELQALLDLRTGDAASARKRLEDLSREVGLPQQQEQRVKQLLASLGAEGTDKP